MDKLRRLGQRVPVIADWRFQLRSALAIIGLTFFTLFLVYYVMPTNRDAFILAGGIVIGYIYGRVTAAWLYLLDMRALPARKPQYPPHVYAQDQQRQQRQQPPQNQSKAERQRQRERELREKYQIES